MAEGSTIFDAVIRAVDQASGPLRAVAGHVHGLGQVFNAAFGEAEGEAKGVHKVGEELHKTGDEAKHAGHEIEHAAHHGHGYEVLAGHISLLRTHFGALSISTGEVGRSLGEFLPAFAALGAAGGLVGLFEMTEHAAESFSQLSNSAHQVGMSAQQYAVFAEVAKTVDVPVTNMATSMFRLNRVIGDSVAGKNKDAAALFHHLGISLRDAQGHMRGAADLLPQLATAFQHTHNPAMQARMAMALFGREGMELLPLLTQGRDKLKELSDAAAKVVFVPQGEAAEQLEQYHTSLLMLTAAVQGFVTEIGTKLAPVLKPMIDLATRWVVANRDWIATRIADYVRQLGYWISNLHFPDILEHMSQWIHSTADLVDHFGGLTTILGAFAFALASPMINAVLGVISVFGRLMGILRALSLLAFSNPILLAVGAVAAAAFLLYDNWGDVKQFFQDLWEDIKSAFNDAWEFIKPIVEAIQAAAHKIASLRGMLIPQHQVDLAGIDLHHTHEVATRPGLPVPLHYGAPLGPFPRLYPPGGVRASQPAAASQGRVRIDLNVRGVPDTTDVRTQSSGIADVDRVDVGDSLLGAGAY